MTLTTTPTMNCDADGANCTNSVYDYYALGVSFVDLVRITPTTRAPGWVSTDHEDYCPEHANEAARTENNDPDWIKLELVKKETP